MSHHPVHPVAQAREHPLMLPVPYKASLHNLLSFLTPCVTRQTLLDGPASRFPPRESRRKGDNGGVRGAKALLGTTSPPCSAITLEKASSFPLASPADLAEPATTGTVCEWVYPLLLVAEEGKAFSFQK